MYILTKADSETLALLDTEAAGGPWKGTHVGAGPHCEMTNDPSSPGWTRFVKAPVRHPEKDEAIYEMATKTLSKAHADRAAAITARAVSVVEKLPADFEPRPVAFQLESEAEEVKAP